VFKKLRLLFIEDSENDTLFIKRQLEKAGYQIQYNRVEDKQGLKKALTEEKWDAIIADYQLPRFNGLEALHVLQESGIDIPFIIVSGSIGENTAVAAMKAGAHDYLMKDQLDRLVPAIERELREAKLRAERREAIKALQESEKKYRLLFEKANDAIFLMKGKYFIDCNKKTLEIFGYNKDQILNHTPFQFSPPNQPDGQKSEEKGLKFIQKALAGYPQFFEWVHTRVNGDLFHVEVSLNALSMGNDQYLLAIVRDISERKEAEQALLNAAREWHATFDAINDSIALLDKRGRITSCNLATKKILGLTYQEILGKSYCELFNHFFSDKNNHPFQKLLRTGERETTEFLLKGRWFHVSVDPIYNDKKELKGAVHIMTDITDRKILEEQLRQSQKMEAIGRLAGGIAHDFNNLLTVINGYSELLLQQINNDNPHHRYVNQIKTAGERAAQLIDKLLAFSRKQIIQPRIVNVNHIILDMDEMLKRLIGEDIAFQIKLDPELNNVFIDPNQMEQVILNLAVNARDAMPDGGDFIIETKNVRLPNESICNLHDLSEGKYICLRIKDTGIGMDDEIKSHIFEPFFTTKAPNQGTGLGLSTVYGIIKQHKGHIEVESKPGEGTTFTIFLPVVEQSTSSTQEKPMEVTISGSETILLVEDEKNVRDLVADFLEKHGFTVFKSTTAEEALKIFQKNQDKIHLLVTDLVLPKMSGNQLANELIKIRPDLKILFMSGYTEDSRIRTDISKQQYSFIQKPFSPATFLRKVREILEQH